MNPEFLDDCVTKHVSYFFTDITLTKYEYNICFNSHTIQCKKSIPDMMCSELIKADMN